MSASPSRTASAWPIVLALCVGLAYVTSQDTAPVTVRPATPHLSVELPPHLDYAGVRAQLARWHAEAPDLTQTGAYGQSSKGKPLCFLRVGNPASGQQRPRVLISGAIHGNEPLSTSVVLGYAGRLLARYGTDAEVTQLLDSRDIYFVPVVSPDSYPHSRHVDSVDPNRDFPGPHDPQHKSTVIRPPYAHRI